MWLSETPAAASWLAEREKETVELLAADNLRAPSGISYVLSGGSLPLRSQKCATAFRNIGEVAVTPRSKRLPTGDGQLAPQVRRFTAKPGFGQFHVPGIDLDSNAVPSPPGRGH